MEEIIKSWKENALKNEDRNFKFIRSLKMKSSGRVDRAAKELHDLAFKKIDCLKCGNCCKTSKPILKNSDIKRIAEFLQISVKETKEKYLEQDEDNDWMINALPCPFLNTDNSCQIYSARPKACQNFPHTNKKGFASRSYQHSANTVVCPAVYFIVENMKNAIRR